MATLSGDGSHWLKNYWIFTTPRRRYGRSDHRKGAPIDMAAGQQHRRLVAFENFIRAAKGFIFDRPPNDRSPNDRIIYEAGRCGDHAMELAHEPSNAKGSAAAIAGCTWF